MTPEECILTVNRGSSSLKFAVYGLEGDGLKRSSVGQIERFDGAEAALVVKNSEGQIVENTRVRAAAGNDVHAFLIDWLGRRIGFDRIVAVGHRIVHGGARHYKPTRVTGELLDELDEISCFDPEHLPAEIVAIKTLAARFPDLPQIACFDTGFHHDIPRVARILPVPRRLERLGVRRYGFHGLSYEFLMEELRRQIGVARADGRVILAHLGAGASLAAVWQGRSIDTSMAFTPTAGLPMATRSGDLDPGLSLFLSRSEQMSAEGFQDMVNRQSGLLGVSETSGDLRDLLANETTDQRAAEAIALFCYATKKWLGAFAAALGGLDVLVFSGGIGEHLPVIRQRICAGLEFLGVRLDTERNSSNASVISDNSSKVSVRVIPTNEELMIARATYQALGEL